MKRTIIAIAALLITVTTAQANKMQYIEGMAQIVIGQTYCDYKISEEVLLSDLNAKYAPTPEDIGRISGFMNLAKFKFKNASETEKIILCGASKEAASSVGALK